MKPTWKSYFFVLKNEGVEISYTFSGILEFRLDGISGLDLALPIYLCIHVPLLVRPVLSTYISIRTPKSYEYSQGDF